MHRLQDIIKIIVPEAEMHQRTLSDWEADVNKMLCNKKEQEQES